MGLGWGDKGNRCSEPHEQAERALTPRGRLAPPGASVMFLTCAYQLLSDKPLCTWTHIIKRPLKQPLDVDGCPRNRASSDRRRLYIL